jgi:hypothetical protein
MRGKNKAAAEPPKSGWVEQPGGLTMFVPHPPEVCVVATRGFFVPGVAAVETGASFHRDHWIVKQFPERFAPEVAA